MTMATSKPTAVKGGKPTQAKAAATAQTQVSAPASAPAAAPAASWPSAEKQAPAAASRDYIVQDSLRLDGKAYQAGDPITLTADQVEGLPAGIVLAAEE